MPWEIKTDHPDCSGFAVVKQGTDELEGCHPSKSDAEKQMAALYANEPGMASARPPRDNITRAVPVGITVTEEGILEGRLARPGEWAEINSRVEGHFLERHGAGAFRKTFKEGPRPKILFQHGKDPGLGERPIAALREVGEDDDGPYYRGDLLDGLPEMILDGLRRGVYGSSHTFRVTKDTFTPNPKPGPHNPKNLPERVIHEVEVMELGPVTWPAYAGATAAMRSMTDEFQLGALTDDPEHLRELVGYLEPAAPITMPPPALPDGAGAEPHSESVSRDEPEPVASIAEQETAPMNVLTREEMATRDREIADELSRVAVEYPGVLPGSVQSRWDELTAEQTELRANMAAWDQRQAYLASIATNEANLAPSRTAAPPQSFNVVRRPSTDEVYDIGAIENRAGSPESREMLLRDNAMRAIEMATYVETDGQVERHHLATLLDYRDSPERDLAKRILVTGSPVYRRAFQKLFLGQPLSPEEQRGTALAVGVDGTGGFAVPFALDPTIIPIGAHTPFNPYRQACRVEQITGTDTWQGLTATAVTATRTTEAATATEQGPTFAQPSAIVQRVHAVVSYSHEFGQDRPDIGAELAVLFAEAKDTEEESNFSTSTSGSIGMFAAHGTSGIYTHIDLTTAHTWAIGDVDNLEAALPIRHRRNAVWFAHRKTIRTIQGLETTGGRLFNGVQYPAVGAIGVNGNTGLQLLGYPVYEVPSATYDVTVDDTPLLWFGDPKSYLIVDRTGMSIELIPNLVSGTPGLPTGQRAVYAMWRNVGKPINTDAGRMLFVKNA